jgi:alanyl-tRNA synthetase
VVRAPFDEMDDLRKISDAAASELVGDWLLLILSPAGRYLGRISESLLKKGITNKIFDSVNKEFDGKGGGRPGLVAGQLNKKLPTLAEIADRLKTGL